LEAEPGETEATEGGQRRRMRMADDLQYRQAMTRILANAADALNLLEEAISAADEANDQEAAEFLRSVDAQERERFRSASNIVLGWLDRGFW
jgi:DNA-binding ferritin-like protein